MAAKRIIDRDVLFKMYVLDNLRIKDICEALGAGNHVVAREIKRHGLHELKEHFNKKHGMSRTRPYGIWRSMKNRCDNPKNSRYQYYGAKGISYCKKWNTFVGFWDDMSDGYSDDLTLERIDNSRGYCKENCQWKSYYEQNSNRDGCLSWSTSSKDVRDKSSVSQSTVYRRKNSGWDDDKIINTPRLK